MILASVRLRREGSIGCEAGPSYFLPRSSIGAANAIVLKSFEGAVNDGTHDIWDSVFHTDTHRWVVVPLAIVLSVALSGVFILMRQNAARSVRSSTDGRGRESTDADAG